MLIQLLGVYNVCAHPHDVKHTGAKLKSAIQWYLKLLMSLRCGQTNKRSNRSLNWGLRLGPSSGLGSARSKEINFSNYNQYRGWKYLKKYYISEGFLFSWRWGMESGRSLLTFRESAMPIFPRPLKVEQYVTPSRHSHRRGNLQSRSIQTRKPYYHKFLHRIKS
jgi:hypothetical protein